MREPKEHEEKTEHFISCRVCGCITVEGNNEFGCVCTSTDIRLFRIEEKLDKLLQKDHHD